MSPALFTDATAATPDHLEVYTDTAHRHRWRYRHRNGRVLADSGEGYARRADALRGAATVLGVTVPPDATTVAQLTAALTAAPGVELATDPEQPAADA